MDRTVLLRARDGMCEGRTSVSSRAEREDESGGEFYKTDVYRVAHQTGRLMDVEFLHNVGAMGANCAKAQKKRVSNLPVGITLGDVPQDFSFPFC